MTADVLPAPRELTRLRTAGLLPALLVVVVWLVARWAADPYVVGVFHDDGVYALLARSIAEGHGFHYLQLPGHPAATHYPPLYPLLLGVLWWVAPGFPANESFLLAFNAGCLATSALGLFLVLRRRFHWPAPAATLVSGVLHVSTPAITLASALLSEPLFLALLWPTLLLAERAVDDAHSTRAMIVAAALMAGLLMSSRTLGLAAVLALPAALCTRRRGREAALAAGVSFLVLVPWTVWTTLADPRVPVSLQGAYGTYGSFFSGAARNGGAALFTHVATLNAREVALSVADRVVPGLPVLLARPALGMLAIAFVLGAWRLGSHHRVTAAFLAMYGCIVLATAFTPWRYLWAVWPLCIAIAAEGTRAAIGGIRSRPARLVAAALMAIPALGIIGTEWRSLTSGSWRQPSESASRQIVPLVAWVRSNTAADDVMLAEGAEVVTLFTGRLAAPPVEFAAADYVTTPSVARTAASLMAMVASVPATHLVSISPPIIAAARSLAQARPGLVEAGTFDGGAAFRIVR